MANCGHILHNIPNEIGKIDLCDKTLLTSSDLTKLSLQYTELIPAGTVFGPFAVRRAVPTYQDELKFIINDENRNKHSFCPLNQEALALKQILPAPSKAASNCEMVLEGEDNFFVKITKPVKNLSELAGIFIEPEPETKKVKTSKLQQIFADTIIAPMKKFVCSKCTLGFTNLDTLTRHQSFYCKKNTCELPRFDFAASNYLQPQPKNKMCCFDSMDLAAIFTEKYSQSATAHTHTQHSNFSSAQQMKSAIADTASTPAKVFVDQQQQLYHAALLTQRDALAGALLADGGAIPLPVTCHDSDPSLVNVVGRPQIVIPVAVHRSRFLPTTTSSEDLISENYQKLQQEQQSPISSSSSRLNTAPLSTVKTINDFLSGSHNKADANSNSVNVSFVEYGIQECGDSNESLSQLFQQFYHSAPSTSTSTINIVNSYDNGSDNGSEETPLDLSTNKRKSSEKPENFLFCSDSSLCCDCGQIKKPTNSNDNKEQKDFDKFHISTDAKLVPSSTVARKRRKCVSINTPSTRTLTVEKRKINSQPPFTVLSQPLSSSKASSDESAENKAIIDVIEVDDRITDKQKTELGVEDLANYDRFANDIDSPQQQKQQQHQQQQKPQPKQRIVCDCGVSFLVQETYNGHKKYYCKNRIADDSSSEERTNYDDNTVNTTLKEKTSQKKEMSPNSELLAGTVIKKARPVCCALCAFRPASQAHLARHLRASHTRPTKCFICKLCGYKGYSERGIKNHLRTTHDAYLHASSAGARKFKSQASVECGNYGGLIDFVRCVSSHNAKI